MTSFDRSDVCVVTGANAGIGRAVATGLMEHGAHVIMACRNMSKCHETQQVLESRNLPGTAQCMLLDVASQASVRTFAGQLEQHLRKSQQRLCCLVNNAGVMGVPPDPDGLDGHLRPNHFGPFLLTCLLLPHMGPGSRIVNVGSRAHAQGALAVDSNGRITGQPWTWYHGYARSKLCNGLFTFELARRLQVNNAGITAYCISPGMVNTGIFAHVPGCLRPVIHWVASRQFRTPEKGAETVVYAATAPELAGASVLLMKDCKAIVPAARARDPDLALQLWSASLQFVGLRPDDVDPRLR